MLLFERSWGRWVMASEFSEETIAAVAQFFNSKRKPVTAKDRKAGPYPYYGAAAIQDWVSDYIFDGMFVLVGEDGTVQTSDGKLMVQLAQGKIWVNNHAHVLQCETEDDTRYLAYALALVDAGPFVTGAAQPKINMGNLKRVTVPWPAPHIRFGVSAIGRAIHDRIDLLRQTNATLEAIAQTLFKSWFVDFDPVRAKAEGREPEGIDAETAALFPSEFEESALGLIPRGWRVAPMGDLVEAVGGSTPDTKNKSFWEPALHHWTSPKDLSGASAPVLLDTERKISDAGLAKIPSGLLPEGTLLMSSRAPIGYLSLAAIAVAINQGYIAMRPGGTLPPLYLYFWCKSNMEAIKGNANGSTFMEISKRAFRPLQTLSPPTRLVERFTDVCGPIFGRIAQNERQARSLCELRDTVLPRLISGKLRLPEVQAAVDEVTA